MRPKDLRLASELDRALFSFHNQKRPLPGVQAPASRKAFIEQLLESIHRVKYISVIRKRNLSPLCADPSADCFDPVKAAVLHQGQENIDESFWLVFLFVHFGKSRSTGWRLVRDVYGRIGSKVHWTWARTSSDPKGFRRWLAEQQAVLRGRDGIPRYFGNHRKYESLNATSANGTGAAVESYVRWVCPPRTHQLLVQDAQKDIGRDPRNVFDRLYRTMNVTRFGRTAKFDYLTMIGKLGLAAIEPGSTYMQGATGPLDGARLLFGKSRAGAQLLDTWLVELEARLNLSFGMQVLEDALCNWQKSPEKFKPFRG